MTNGKHAPPARVPTLTEVVELRDAAPAAQVTEDSAAPAAAPAFVERRANTPALQEDQIVQRVLTDLQRQIDLMLETRMRETLTPLLTRATDALLRDTRHELASTLRDVVARAVAQELARHRGR
jgi:3-oxoacyl-ACP reductase-like protein